MESRRSTNGATPFESVFAFRYFSMAGCLPRIDGGQTHHRSTHDARYIFGRKVLYQRRDRPSRLEFPLERISEKGKRKLDVSPERTRLVFEWPPLARLESPRDFSGRQNFQRANEKALRNGASMGPNGMETRNSRKMDLHIITPCSRPQNLSRIADSIILAAAQSSGTDLFLHWWIIFDAPQVGKVPVCSFIRALAISSFSGEGNAQIGVSGNVQRNFAIDRIESGFVYFLDDDTVMHARLLETFEKHKTNMAFHQNFADGKHRLDTGPQNMKPCCVDSGQVILKRETIGNHRWNPWDYCADGHFIEACYQSDPKSFLFVPKVLSIYNALR